MRGRTAEAAVAAYVALRRRVIGCVTEQLNRTTGYRPLNDGDHSLSFVPLNRPATLRTEDGRRLGLSVYEFYQIDQVARSHYEVRLTAYRFHILDRLGGELLAFHWHPAGASPVVRPHLHLSGRLPPLVVESGHESFELGKLHIPTGMINLTDIVRLLVEEFEVEPRRMDWQTVLAVDLPA